MCDDYIRNRLFSGDLRCHDKLLTAAMACLLEIFTARPTQMFCFLVFVHTEVVVEPAIGRGQGGVGCRGFR